MSCYNCNRGCVDTCGCLDYISAECIIYKGSNLPCTDIDKNDDLETVIEKLEDAICDLSPSGATTYVVDSCDANIEVTSSTSGNEVTYTVCLSDVVTDQITENTTNIATLQTCCDESIKEIISDNGSIYVSNEGGGTWNIEIFNPSGDVFTNGSGTNAITRTAYMGVSSGIASFNFGENTTTVSGDYSAGGGFQTTTSGDYSFGFGDSVGATGDYSVVFGDTSISSGAYSFAQGLNAVASKYGQYSRSAGANTQLSQKTELLLRRNTTNATPAIMYLDGSSLLPSILNNSVVMFSGTLVAVQLSGTSGTVGDTATWKFYGTIRNIAGTTTLVDSVIYLDGPLQTFTNIPTQFAQVAAAATWTVAISADDVNDVLEIQVTGEANKNILWHSVLEFNELQFAA